MSVMSACLVFNPVMVDNYAAFFNCTPVGVYDGSAIKLFILVSSAGASSCLLLDKPVFNWCFSFAPGFSKLFGAQGSPSSDSLLNLLGLCF